MVSSLHLGLCFSLVQSLSCVQLFATPWTTAHQASLSITNSRSSLRLTSIESVMPSNHLILGRPLLLLPSIFPRIRAPVLWPGESQGRGSLVGCHLRGHTESVFQNKENHSFLLMKFLEKNNFIGKTNYSKFTRCIFLNFNMSLLFKKIFLNLIYPY